ncbi:hypothetical protein ACFOUO_09470 [Salinithrix halophila]|uniref:Phr family secreted Rap phosphatase inhibitor n=1 Tax=Salinithrix halophila TaxID=1485204 RepID=A0ABV8JDM8_9BACL
MKVGKLFIITTLTLSIFGLLTGIWTHTSPQPDTVHVIELADSEPGR